MKERFLSFNPQPLEVFIASNIPILTFKYREPHFLVSSNNELFTLMYF